MASPVVRATDRAALARAFMAKAVFNIPLTNMLIERLGVDKTLRRLCGWERLGAIPSEATFSRAFAEFANSALPSRLHEALITRTHADRLVGHISRDATSIEAREKPMKAARPEKKKRGRPRKGEERPKEIPRLERQSGMSLSGMLADLPRHCAVGITRDAKGRMTSWTGYKLHLDVADGDSQLPADLRLPARQPGGDPAGDDDGGAADQPVRSDGQRLRRPGDQGNEPRSRPCHRRQPAHGASGNGPRR